MSTSFISRDCIVQLTCNFTSVFFTEGTIVIASGGDDNALVISKVTAKGDNYDLIGQCKELSAHAAQITGNKSPMNSTTLVKCV